MVRDAVKSLALAVVLLIACRQITWHDWCSPSPLIVRRSTCCSTAGSPSRLLAVRSTDS
jgi:hypothetical protein